MVYNDSFSPFLFQSCMFGNIVGFITPFHLKTLKFRGGIPNHCCLCLGKLANVLDGLNSIGLPFLNRLNSLGDLI